jgi:hypothetical protein
MPNDQLIQAVLALDEGDPAAVLEFVARYEKWIVVEPARAQMKVRSCSGALLALLDYDPAILRNAIPRWTTATGRPLRPASNLQPIRVVRSVQTWA